MSRTLVPLALLLIALSIPLASVRGDEPAKPVLTKTGSGTLDLSGTPGEPPMQGTYSGTTTLSAGTLQIGAPLASGATLTPASGITVNNGVSTTFSGVIGDPTLVPAVPAASLGAVSLGTAAASCARPGKVFYLITEGAGLGDNVHSVPCTGNETVLDAVSLINGLSQVSSTKMWIARPSSTDHDKSTILPINWEDISRHGINTTNYTLQPGDRLVFGEDPLVTRANLLSKKTSIVERLMGITGLTTSTVGGLNSTPGGAGVVKDLVQKGYFTDDEEMKRLVLEIIALQEQESKKAGAKPAAELVPAPGR